jgi:hypothetical protein
MSQLAIEAAEKGDYANRRTTFTIENPYQDQDEYHKWFAKGQIGLEKNRKLHAVLQFLK